MMRNKGVVYQGEPSSPEEMDDKYARALSRLNVSRKLVAGIILLVALVAFELFNFDTTRYALHNLLGDVSFAGLKWAAILAIAFCAIDFAGLTRLFTPEKGQKEPTAVWYLMGAWLIGATMNAVMTWWAISLTLLAHEFGNEVLSREQLLRWVPFFVAALVWLTRILFIGAFSVAGEYIFDVQRLRPSTPRTVKPKVTSPAPHPVHTRRPAMAARPAERSAPGKRPSAKHPPRPAPSQRRSPGLQTRGRSR
ncbi:MAG: hypothetical protein GY796_19810 [Chloroflexi bacterium]|nr:hypothetical protein [Chloroflexota bacterium]